MKKGILFGLIVLVLLGAGLWFYAHQANWFYPRVTFSIVQINSIGAADAEMTVKVDIKNRAPFSMRFEHVDFIISADSTVLLETFGHVPVHLKSLEKTTFEVPVKVHLAGIKETARRHYKDSTNYRFQALFINQKGSFFPDSLQISTSELMPTYHLPRVSLSSMEKDKLLAKGGPTFFLDLLIENRNAFPLEIKDPSYAVIFEDNEVLFEGHYPEALFVQPRKTKTARIHVQMDKDTLLKHTGKLLFNKQELDVKLIFKGRVITRNQYIDGCNVTILVKGDMKQLMNGS